MSQNGGAELPPTGRILGLDPGSSRIGVAVSDGLRLAAHALEVLEAKDAELVSRIQAIVDEYEITLVVVGLPTSLDGTESASARRARRLASALESSLDVPITLYDERYTSKVAERVLLDADLTRTRRRAKIDKVAAAVMLQGFLERHRPSGTP